MLRDIRRVLGSNIGVGIVGLASSLIFPRILSVSDYAYYQTFALYLSFVGLFHLGIPDGMFVEYGGSLRRTADRGRLKSQMILLALVLVGFSAAGLAAYLVTGSRLIAYLTLCVVGTNVFSSYRLMLQAWGEFRQYSTVNLAVPAAILLGAIVLYAAQGNLSGDDLVRVNVTGYILFAIWVVRVMGRFTRGHNTARVLSRDNFQLWKVGVSVMLGGIATIAFVSVGRQFVLWFYSSTDFAMYSFALSMQAIMSLLIGAVGQPMYYRLASGDRKPETLKRMKEQLLTLGSMSALAYYGCVVFVDWYVPKYHDSLPVILAYFTVFPAMSVVNCLYVNLYKVTRQLRRYLSTLTIMLAVSVALSAITLVTHNYVLIALAASASYYVWLVYAARHFPGLSISVRDLGFLAVYFALYHITTQTMRPIGGALFYAVAISLTAAILYRESFAILVQRAAELVGVRRSVDNDGH